MSLFTISFHNVLIHVGIFLHKYSLHLCLHTYKHTHTYIHTHTEVCHGENSGLIRGDLSFRLFGLLLVLCFWADDIIS
jgi:hypothetical protein